MARIMIGEPMPEIQELLALLVRRLGHEPVRYADRGHVDADAADLALLEPAAPEFLELARTLRRLQPAFPLIFISNEPESVATRELAPVRHILKPFQREQLSQAVEAALRAGDSSHASHT